MFQLGKLWKDTSNGTDTLKKVGKTILDSGVEALADVAASSLDPTNNNSVAENAQLRLDQARKDIADILRSKRKGKSRKTTENLDSDDLCVWATEPLSRIGNHRYDVSDHELEAVLWVKEASPRDDQGFESFSVGVEL